MKALDAGQQAQLDDMMRENPWTRRSVPSRLILLLLLVSPVVAIVGVIAALITPHWLPFTAAGTGLLLLSMSPYVLAPAWFLQVNFRAWSVSDAEADKWARPDLP